MGEVDDAGAEELAAGAPEDLRERAVHTEEPAVERHQRHADRCVLERAAEPLLGFPQLALGAPPVGEVAGAVTMPCTDGSSSRLVATASTTRQLPSACRSRNSVRSVPFPARVRSKPLAACARSSGWIRSNTLRADQWRGVDPEDPLGRRARVHEETVGIDDRHDVARVPDHGLEPRFVVLQELRHPVDGVRSAAADHARRHQRHAIIVPRTPIRSRVSDELTARIVGSRAQILRVVSRLIARPGPAVGAQECGEDAPRRPRSGWSSPPRPRTRADRRARPPRDRSAGLGQRLGDLRPQPVPRLLGAPLGERPRHQGAELVDGGPHLGDAPAVERRAGDDSCEPFGDAGRSRCRALA